MLGELESHGIEACLPFTHLQFPLPYIEKDKKKLTQNNVKEVL